MIKSTGAGVLQGVQPTSLSQLLFQISAADLTLTTDQAFTKVFGGTNWAPTSILFRWSNGAFGTACAGGIYTAATKGGTAIVAASQSYAALTGAGTLVTAAIAVTNAFFTVTPILSLTTGNTGALGAKVFIFGVDLD